jgi:ubiquinone/menaquinone biosynthesis C-methylase UbiE
MARPVRLRELLVGVEGLALLRRLYDEDAGEADKRLAEVRSVLEDESFAVEEVTTETDPRTGYGLWAERYDRRGNPIVALEQKIVWSLLDRIEPGRALDAACGTGRHARHLVDVGHRVVGVDLTSAMLERARANVPEATFIEADLREIPLGDEQFDLAVSALALAHLPDLHPAIAELARVLRPGGRLVISVLHPFQALLGWQAPFVDESGRRAFVREYPHTHGEYFDAFAASGLRVRSCLEPRLDDELIQSKRRAFTHIPEATVAAYTGLPAVLVWDLEKGATPSRLTG